MLCYACESEREKKRGKRVVRRGLEVNLRSVADAAKVVFENVRTKEGKRPSVYVYVLHVVIRLGVHCVKVLVKGWCRRGMVTACLRAWPGGSDA